MTPKATIEVETEDQKATAGGYYSGVKAGGGSRSIAGYEAGWCVSNGRRVVEVSPVASQGGGGIESRKYYENTGENLSKNVVGQC